MLYAYIHTFKFTYVNTYIHTVCMYAISLKYPHMPTCTYIDMYVALCKLFNYCVNFTNQLSFPYTPVCVAPDEY